MTWVLEDTDKSELESPAHELFYRIDDFVNDLNFKYLEIKTDLGIEREIDLFDINHWNALRRHMRASFQSEGIDRDMWLQAVRSLLIVRDMDLSTLVLGDHDLDRLFANAESLRADLMKIM